MSYHFSLIGGKVVEKALLDMGASVNLLPYSVYKQLGLGELKPTSITLSLADRSVKFQGGNGLMQLTFGNMTLELNIFYMSKKANHSGEEEEGLSEPLDVLATLQGWRRREEILPLFNKEEGEAAEEETPKLNLKPLPVELKYTYLEENNQCPVIISSSLTSHQEISILEVLKRCKKAIGWQISDLKGISPLVCTHHIYMEEEAKPIRQPQRRLNPHLQEVVRAKVLKLLQAGIIYPISDSPWVSPTQVVPKKSGITMVQNEKGEEIATRLTSGVGESPDHPFLLFLGRKNAFGLCNAPATFQRCMLSIFSDMVERIMEVFMDDITVYGGTFEECLVNLEAVLNRCIEKDLVLNWEKFHFMGLYEIYTRFSKLSKPLCELLAKDAKFIWDERCPKYDFAIGAVLGKEKMGSLRDLLCKQTLNEAQETTHYRERIVSCGVCLRQVSCLSKKAPWYAHIANYLVIGEVPSEWNAQNRKHFFAKIHAYYWEEPFLFKYCADQIIRKCVPEEKQQGILSHCHENACGGHFASQKTAMKGGSQVSQREHILRFGVPKAIISDGGTHFLNRPFETLLAKYGVKHKVATPYHPQTSGQVETAYKTILGMSSYSLVYGKACHLPVKIEYKAWWAIKRLNMDLIRAGEKREAQVEVDRPFHYSPSASNGMVELLNSKITDIFKVNGHRLKPFIEPFKPEKEEINLLEHRKPDQRRAQHTAILRQIQHHLGITSAPEHAISQLIKAITGPPFVDQPMPHQEPPTGEAAEHHSTSFRRYHFLPIVQSLLSH
ncbi:hypothetical protein CK203_116161 [Vitis vinifera]|uniref:Integrase catalytic domain-containing protein n=1 Tax=Vitis vinifera TaxID=29760 RepID=A0A438D7S5_VITVI|nr:hypothetical protein CK203_116161 [Vitis vinifera]